MSGALYVVATPIGNLEDLSPRARQTLATVELIAAEDTRHTGRLLSHFGVDTPLLALHDHNEAERVGKLIDAMKAGKSVALVSDAGTPLVSDPGYRLVHAAHVAGITVVPVPGACAAVAALSVAGLPTDRFCFEGFLPAKQKARRDRLAGLVGESRTMVFYEAVHRLGASVDDMIAAFGTDRPAFIGRELTKLHEQLVAGTLGTLQTDIEAGSIVHKGEFVIVVAGTASTQGAALDVDDLLVALAGRLPAKEVAAIVAKATTHRRNELYARLLELTRAAGD